MSPVLIASLLAYSLADPPGLVARIGTPAFRLPCCAADTQLHASPDGRRLYAVSNAFSSHFQPQVRVAVLDTRTGRRLVTYYAAGRSERVAFYEFASEGLRVLILDEERRSCWVRVIDPDTGEVVREGKPWPRPGKDEIQFLLQPTGLSSKSVPLFRDDKSTHFLDPETGTLTPFDPPLPHDAQDTCASPDGRMLVVCVAEKAWRVYDLPSGKRRKELPKDPGISDVVGFTPDGRGLVTRAFTDDAGWAIELRDLDGKFVRTLLENQDEDAWVVLDPTGKTYAGRNRNRDFADFVSEIRDLRTGQQIARIAGDIESAVYSPDGKTLWVRNSSTVVPIEVATGQPVANRTDPPWPVRSFGFQPDGQLVGVLADTVATWDPRNGRFAHSVSFPPRLGRHEQAELDPTGERVRCVSSRGVETIWDHSRDREIPAPAGLEPPDGKGWMLNEWLQVIRDGGETLVRVLAGDKADGRRQPAEWRVSVRVNISSPVVLLAPGGKRLVVGPFNEAPAEATFALIDLTDPKSVPVITTSVVGGQFGILRPEFSPDGRWMVFAGSGHRKTAQGSDLIGRVIVFDLTARRLAADILIAQEFSGRSCAFSPDCRTLAVGTFGTAVLIETATWRVRSKIRSPRDVVNFSWRESLRWSPDGRLLAMSTPDDRIAVWDVAWVGPPFAGSLADSWGALADPDARAAFAAIQRLATNPEQALALIQAKPFPRGLRAVRAVEAVEWMSSPEAAKQLEAWAEMVVSAPELAAEAQGALARRPK